MFGVVTVNIAGQFHFHTTNIPDRMNGFTAKVLQKFCETFTIINPMQLLSKNNQIRAFLSQKGDMSHQSKLKIRV